MKIDIYHGRTIDDLNSHIEIMEEKYECKIKIINVSSTQDGYDLFYTIIK